MNSFPNFVIKPILPNNTNRQHNQNTFDQIINFGMPLTLYFDTRRSLNSCVNNSDGANKGFYHLPKNDIFSSNKNSCHNTFAISNNNIVNYNAQSVFKLSSDIYQKKSKLHFTKEEDEKIKDFVKKFGTKKWKFIVKFMKGRTAKQCRDRYSNYLSPGIFHGQWSNDEEKLLIELYKKYGSKWSIIHKYFPKRNTNSIKNQWNYLIHKSCEYYNNDLIKNEGKVESKEKEKDPKSKKNDFDERNDLLIENNSNINEKAITNPNSTINVSNKPIFDLIFDYESNVENDEWNLFD